MKDMSYSAVMNRNNEIMKQAVGIDYEQFEYDGIGFAYEEMMQKVGYDLDEIRRIQSKTDVGQTPMYELKNFTQIARELAPQGKGARIFIKDEAANPSGSFKARRAAVSIYHAQKHGYEGVVAATSGNYGAAVASQAVKRGLKPIIVQEVYDSREVGQPEIIEKGRKCEAYGAEVLQLTTGPELFYTFLKVLEETGYFNASLYTPFGIAGVETLGYELAVDMKKQEGKYPDAVVVTNAGGGNLTGTVRGLKKGGATDTEIIAASVNLEGLHMASDYDFNRKSFTTGHTGFGVPFMTWPDRSDVPRSAARAIRYAERYVTINQGEVFYTTEALAQIEGIERGPAGNTSLAAAISIAQEMDKDEILVVQETEYTGAGKHPTAQLTFAKENGIEVKRGNPREEVPGESVVIPENPGQIEVQDLDLNKLKTSYIANVIKKTDVDILTEEDIKFLIEETNTNRDFVIEALIDLDVKIK